MSCAIWYSPQNKVGKASPDIKSAAWAVNSNGLEWVLVVNSLMDLEGRAAWVANSNASAWVWVVNSNEPKWVLVANPNGSA